MRADSAQDSNHDLNARCTAWLRAAAGGDETAFAEFYDATLSRAWSLVRRITRSAPAAEDVLMDAYMQAWRTAAAYDASRGSPLAWLLIICRTRALDWLRRRDPAQAHPDPQTLADDPGLAGEPADLLDCCQINHRLHTAVRGLSAQQRQLVGLIFFGDYSHGQLASITGMPLGTVKSHVRRALLRLREQMAGERE